MASRHPETHIQIISLRGPDCARTGAQEEPGRREEVQGSGNGCVCWVTVTYSTLLLWAKVADGSEQVRDISQWRDAD